MENEHKVGTKVQYKKDWGQTYWSKPNAYYRLQTYKINITSSAVWAFRSTHKSSSHVVKYSSCHPFNQSHIDNGFMFPLALSYNNVLQWLFGNCPSTTNPSEEENQYKLVEKRKKATVIQSVAWILTSGICLKLFFQNHWEQFCTRTGRRKLGTSASIIT